MELKDIEQFKSKIRRREEVIKMYTTNYCNKKQNALEKINKTKRWFFEKFAKIDKSLVMLSKKKRVRSPKLSIPQVE